MITRRTAMTALIAVMATPAAAQHHKAGDLEISGTWTRATAPTARAGGGFLTITNKGTVADRLVSASSPAAAKVEVHEMKMDGSIMRMRELENGLDIPPGATVALKPGGYHLMLMELTAPIAQGSHVPVTLVFEKAGKVEIQLKAEAIGARQSGHGTH